MSKSKNRSKSGNFSFEPKSSVSSNSTKKASAEDNPSQEKINS